MQTIGVLGGMSWESSLDWYRIANERVREELGGFHSAPILLDSLDFAEIEAMQASGDWDAAGEVLAAHAKRLEAAGAGLVVLCTNTMHLVADRITDAIGVPFLHIADTTADAISAAGLQTVGLLGTAFTMEQTFYRDRLGSHGITALIPDAEDRATVHGIIYDELVQGIVEKPKPEDAPSTLAVVGRYVLTGKIFDYLQNIGAGTGGEIQLTDGIAALMKDERVLAYRYAGTRYDCGSKAGYLKAMTAMGLKHPETAQEFADFLRTLEIPDGRA